MQNRSKWIFSLLIFASLFYGEFGVSQNAYAFRFSTSNRIGLHVVGAWNSTYSYRLDTLNSCSVGDANLAFVNQATTPVSITGIRVILPKTVRAHVDTRLLAFRPHETTGEVAPSFSLKEMASGRNVTARQEQMIDPYRKSKTWYFIVFRIKVTSPISDSWVIRGARVSYKVSGLTKTLVLRQRLVLPPQSKC